jgi:hypothetical protein
MENCAIPQVYQVSDYFEIDEQGFLRNLTAQKIFDHTVRSLIKQGETSKKSDGTCSYRVYNKNKTLMCAFGIWIPENVYSSTNFEGWDVNFILRDSFFKVKFPEEYRKFNYLFKLLQGFHDYDLYISNGEIHRSSLRNLISRIRTWNNTNPEDEVNVQWLEDEGFVYGVENES